jgi:hypothetical protein
MAGGEHSCGAEPVHPAMLTCSRRPRLALNPLPALASWLRTEYLPAENKSMRRCEIDCLLSVCGYLVGVFPFKQIFSDEITKELSH